MLIQVFRPSTAANQIGFNWAPSTGRGETRVPLAVVPAVTMGLSPSVDAEPSLVRKTVFARPYEVPLTRCYVVVEHAEGLECDIDWGNPSLVEADYLESTFSLRSGSFATGCEFASAP